MPVATTIVGKRVDNRYLVREKDERRARDLGAVALVLAPLALVILVFAWENVEVIRKGYHLRGLRAERDRLVEENRRLRSRLAGVTSLAEAEKRARIELGFTPPTPQQTIQLVWTTTPASPSPVEVPR